jgi:hypothetical protein
MAMLAPQTPATATYDTNNLGANIDESKSLV